eukprot:SAG31_NODE_339_length_17487_cov_20.764435_5_plen_187_part_00
MDYEADQVEGLLQSAHKHALQLAVERELVSVAFPALSCGVFGYPYDDAAAIAVRTAIACLRGVPRTSNLRCVAFVLFEQPAWDAWEADFNAAMRNGELYVETGDQSDALVGVVGAPRPAQEQASSELEPAVDMRNAQLSQPRLGFEGPDGADGGDGEAEPSVELAVESTMPEADMKAGNAMSMVMK